MYPSCVNLTEDLRSMSLCEQVQNITDSDEPQIFDEELERIVSVSVFILFGLIGIAGLLGNGLVVVGKYCRIKYNSLYQMVLSTLYIYLCSRCLQSNDAINNQHPYHKFSVIGFVICYILCSIHW